MEERRIAPFTIAFYLSWAGLGSAHGSCSPPASLSLLDTSLFCLPLSPSPAPTPPPTLETPVLLGAGPNSRQLKVLRAGSFLPVIIWPRTGCLLCCILSRLWWWFLIKSLENPYKFLTKGGHLLWQSFFCSLDVGLTNTGVFLWCLPSL